jgi:cytidylate kinase
MYRAVAWKALLEGVPATDAAALAELARRLRITLSPLTPEGKQTVLADDEDVTEAIRTPEVSSLTSPISALPDVRRVIVEQQREMARRTERGVVLEGRDIGTVVFPDAEVKIFLTASPEERAKRRYKELRNRGLEVSCADVLADQIARDTRDTQRPDSPLRAAPDAILLDTDGLTIEAVADKILALSAPRLDREHHA